MTLQIGHQIIQMKCICFLRLSKRSADAVNLSLIRKVYFTTICASLPRPVYHTLLIKGTRLFFRIKSIEHDPKECCKCAFAPSVHFMKEIDSFHKIDA